MLLPKVRKSAFEMIERRSRPLQTAGSETANATAFVKPAPHGYLPDVNPAKIRACLKFLIRIEPCLALAIMRAMRQLDE